jgi:NADH dehydrogenase
MLEREVDMILVVGATGLLGSEICRRLRGAGHSVRALVRANSAPDRVGAVQSTGAATMIGDLKSPSSLLQACEGVSAVITTASSTFSRQEGDSIETVDRQGHLNLIDAAKRAAVPHFVHVSIPPDLHYDCPLFQAKRDVEAALVRSGIEYTILQGNYFMEVWLSPTLGFDYPNARATVYGSGEQPLAWVSYRDVAGLAVDALGVAAARNRVLLAAGPENLTPLHVVRIFEEMTGRTFTVEHVPLAALEKQYAEAADPLSRSFAALTLEYAHGCPMDMRATLDLLPRPLTTIRDYAATAGRGS